ncbi:hypothetical protein LCGC14_2376210 [marine sediment metagenome]|uniref:Uncharacterized protein n=1 Tax=marine sediment metagenome TaxID=412755 RepID=A0A0F9EER2_9ZZZZ
MSLQAAFRKRLRKAASRPKAGPGGPGYGPSRRPQSGKGMGVPGGVAKPGWATTKQPIPGGGSKREKAGPYTDMPLASKPPGWKPPRIPRPKETGDPGGSIWAPPGKTRKVNSREDKPRRRAGGKFKQVPADNPYAGGHRNVVAATMKAAVTKAARIAGGK